MLFTDSYGEQSCTAGRSSFITGQSVLRTGLSKVGIPASPIGMSDKIVTIAALLKEQGYATGQFGKNHLGDLNHMLPTNHGFDEFFGNLYHLNAEEEPEMDDYPKDPEVPRDVRAARRDPLLGHRQGRQDRRAALGQGRQAEDRGHGAAHEEAHGNLRR
jgi:arylsulfatase A-like enzyme